MATFDIREVEDAIVGTEFAGCLMHFPSVASTNDLAHQAAKAGTRHGVWIADEQTAGRGRGGHVWHSTAGEGLYMTALISPPLPMQSALELSLRTAIAAQSAIALTTGFRIRDEIDIRWPNDLLLNKKKIGGILIETVVNPATASGLAMLRHAIVGIGINCNHTGFPQELDGIATSLRRELSGREMGRPSEPIRREPLAAATLVALDAEIRRLTTHNSQLATYNLSQYSSWITGKRVRVEARDDAPSYTGITTGLDANGFLLVNGDDGQLHTVLSGGLREL